MENTAVLFFLSFFHLAMLSSQTHNSTLRIVFRKMLTGQRNTAPLDWLHPSLVAPGNGLKGTMCPAGWEIIWLSWTLAGVQEIGSGPGWFWLMISRGRELICVWPIKRAHRHRWHTRVSLPSVCHWWRCVRAGEIFHSLSTNHFRCILHTAVW